MFNQIINSPNLLNFILPIFLADEDMRSDDEMYDKVPEKLIIHHYCKIPVCFYSFPDKKILRNSDFRAFNHGVKELYNAAVKNLEKSEFFIDPYYDEYDNIDDNIAEKLLDSEGYDPRKLFICLVQRLFFLKNFYAKWRINWKRIIISLWKGSEMFIFFRVPLLIGKQVLKIYPNICGMPFMKRMHFFMVYSAIIKKTGNYG